MFCFNSHRDLFLSVMSIGFPAEILRNLREAEERAGASALTGREVAAVAEGGVLRQRRA
ncbi:hypothetical protein [Sodalis praecaptivus]|uniref:hypothetical protein n=1 Tax=Sodalis TaxID=84565 RepID=UPI0004BAFCAF|nr:hypothetical protein [Sodalis praecaptivus]